MAKKKDVEITPDKRAELEKAIELGDFAVEFKNSVFFKTLCADWVKEINKSILDLQLASDDVEERFLSLLRAKSYVDVLRQKVGSYEGRAKMARAELNGEKKKSKIA